MKRIFIAGIALPLCGIISARIQPAAAGRTEPLRFVFLRLDPQEGIALLRPMIAPDIGVQLDAASRALQSGAVLRCQPITREHPAIVEGQLAKVTDLVLHCDDQQFVVKGLDFSQRTK